MISSIIFQLFKATPRIPRRILQCTPNLLSDCRETSVPQHHYPLKLVSETPQIVNYVRVLRIELHNIQMASNLEVIASILPMFPLLECIRLTKTFLHHIFWQEDLPQSFRTAVENCLHLPTLRMIHVDIANFPLYLLDNNLNIDCISFSGPGRPEIPEAPHSTTRFLQLRSLDVSGVRNPFRFFDSWAKQRIVKLQSLKHGYDQTVLEQIFDICSDTLINLDLEFWFLHEKVSCSTRIGTSLLNTP